MALQTNKPTVMAPNQLKEGEVQDSVAEEEEERRTLLLHKVVDPKHRALVEPCIFQASKQGVQADIRQKSTTLVVSY